MQEPSTPSSSTPSNVSSAGSVDHVVAPSLGDYTLIFQHAPVGIALATPDGDPIRSNAALVSFLGYTGFEDEFRSIRVIDRTHPDDRSQTEELIEEVRRGERPSYTLEKRYIRRDGATVWGRSTLRGVRDAEGKISHMLVIIEDLAPTVAARKAREESESLQSQLVTSQKLEAVAQLSGSVAHDFNNILTAMGIHLELLLDRMGPGHEFAGDMDTLKHAVGRAAGITRQLLMFSRRDAARREVTNIDSLTQNVTKLLHRLLGENIRLFNTQKNAKDKLECMVDPGMIEQVLTNLILNARDAIEDAGVITINTRAVEIAPGKETTVSKNSLARPGSFVAVSVEDNGQGMSPQVLSRIFDPFFTTKSEGRGTGLGLPTVLNIIDQHDGWIDVASEEGDGATFTFFLPRHLESKAPAPEKEEIRGARPGGTETVLIVEDEDSVRSVCSFTLKRFGYQVMTAVNGDAAVDLLSGPNSPKVDLVVSDVNMPGRTSGPDLADWLRQRRPEVPFVLMSGTGNAHGKNTPLRRIIRKPFVLDELLRTVRVALDERKATK